MSLIATVLPPVVSQPVPARLISLDEAAGFAPPTQSKPRTIDRVFWKAVLTKSGHMADVQRMEKAEAKRARKAKR